MRPIPPSGAGARRRGRTLAVAALVALALAACDRQPLASRPPEPGDKPAARVAGETVWVSDVKRQAVAQGLIGEGEPLDVTSELFSRALNELVDQKLLAREAARLKLQREKVVQQRLAAAHDKVLGDVYIENLVDRAVNENAVRALYEEQQKLSTHSEELSARQIVVASQADADAVKKLLDTGASFEALALQRSTDQATRFNGGELGYFTLDSMPDPYKAALASAQKGQTIGPFKIDAGFAIVKVEDRRPEAPISLEEARPQIVRFLTYDQIRTELERLRSGAKVEMLLGRPETAAGQPREPASAPPAAANAVGPAPEAATESGARVTAPASAPAPAKSAQKSQSGGR